MSTVRFTPEPKPKDSPKGSGGIVDVDPPLLAPRPAPRTKMQIIVPAVVGVAFLGMIALIFSQPALRSGPVGYVSFGFPIMMLMSFAMMSSRFGGSSGDRNNLTQAQLEEKRREYLRELDDKRLMVEENARAQFEQLRFYHPEPAALAGLVGSARMWERRGDHLHFGRVRVGVGSTDLAMHWETPKLGRPEDYDPVTFEAFRDFLEEQKSVRGCAKPLALTKYAGVGLVGSQGMEPVYGLVRAMICQACVFHAPRDLKVMVVTDDPARWDWVKWLPHNELDGVGAEPVRMVWSSAEEMAAALAGDLGPNGRKGFGEGSAPLPHWLVFNDQARVDSEWATLTRKNGVTGVTFVRLAPAAGAGVEFGRDCTFFVTADAVRDRHGTFAATDELAECVARVVARKMARFRSDVSAPSVGPAAKPKIVDLFEILGIPDAADLDVDRLWAPTRSGPPFEESSWGEKWLEIPIGLDMETGRPLALDFKEPHQFSGMGDHLVMVGTTGSGKSKTLTALVLSACLTHSPETLNIAFFDWKGSTTAHAIAGLPHVVAAMNNLRHDALWIERMGDVIYGELSRRKRMLDKARVSDASEYEYLRIHGGEKLEPMPALIIIIDEFTQMFVQHPPAKAIVDEIGRQGRALHVKLIMASQRLGHEMQMGVMGNVPMRVALRVLEAEDSRVMIGNDDAVHLPQKPGGAGILRVKGRPRLVAFQTAYVEKRYEPPRRRAEAAAVRTQVGYVPPREFKAVGMEALALPAVTAPTPEAQEASRTILGADGRPLRQIQAAEASLQRRFAGRCHQMWLPPLEPLPVDELVRRLRGRAWHEDYGHNRGLRFPVGVEDRPFRHAQRVYAVDMSGVNCAIVGRQDAGKTTAAATMITGAALMYSPQRVQFLVIALSGPALNDVEALPHVGSFTRGSDAARVGRTIAEVATLIDDRERAFLELGLDVDKFRARKFAGAAGGVPDDPFGDVFLVIDGWAQFAKDHERLVFDVEAILRRGPGYGVHTILTASGWVSGKLTTAMTPELSANVELKLGENEDLNRNRAMAVAKKVPFGEREVDDDDERDDDEVEALGAGVSVGEERQMKVVKDRGRGC